MKTIFKIILCITSLFILSISTNLSYAEDPTSTTIQVTEKVPGVECTAVADKIGLDGEPSLYDCKVERGFSSIMKMMGAVLKYFTFIAGLLAVLMLVVGGIMYSMGGADEGMKTKSKEFITKSLLGLVLLLMSGTILYAVAPWVYK